MSRSLYFKNGAKIVLYATLMVSLIRLFVLQNEMKIITCSLSALFASN